MDILDALDAYEDFEEETNVRPYEDDVDWESMLPPDWESIVRRAYRGPLEYDSFEDLYNQLCNHVLLGDGREELNAVAPSIGQYVYELVIRDESFPLEGCWIERETGDFIRSYSARSLDFNVASIGGNWLWLRKEGSRFPEVAYLESSPCLEVTGEIRTRLPWGSYSFTWVLQFDRENTAGFMEGPLTQPAIFFFSDGFWNLQTDTVYFPLTPNTASRVRRGGWLEYDHHIFTVTEDEHMREKELKFSLSETVGGLMKSGLYLDGVIIRPVPFVPRTEEDQLYRGFEGLHVREPGYELEQVEVEEEEEKEEEDDDDDSDREETNWKKLLPRDYETIVRIAKGGPLQYDSHRELYDRLCDGILLEDGNRGYWLDRVTNGVCRSYSARTLSITWGDDLQYWKWAEENGSRFAESACLLQVVWLDVKGEVRVRLPSGRYTLSWVLKFDEELEHSSWRNIPVTLTATDGKVSKTQSLHFPLDAATRSRMGDERWEEYDALHFKVDDVNDMDEVTLKFSLAETASGSWKYDLFIDGVVIRPNSALA